MRIVTHDEAATRDPDHFIVWQSGAYCFGRHIRVAATRQQQRETESEPKALHQSSGMPDMASLSKRRTTALASSKGNS
jgi:hypothetical protein